MASSSKFARFVPYIRLSLIVILIAGGVLLGAVCTASSVSIVHAQGPLPTPTPNPETIAAREKAKAEQDRAAQLTAKFQTDQSQLINLQNDIAAAQQGVTDANASAASATERANALDAQGALSYANQAALLAALSQYSITLVNDRVSAIEASLPSVITLTQQNGQLIGDNKVLQADNDRLKLNVAALLAAPPKVPPPLIDPSLVAFVVAAVLITVACLIVFAWLQLKIRRAAPAPAPMVWQLPPVMATNGGDEPIANTAGWGNVVTNTIEE
jgi:hypothetical protein